MSSNNLLKRTVWTEAESEFLKKTYLANIDSVGPHNVFPSRRELWEEITACVNSTFQLNRSKDQCVLQYTLLQRQENQLKQETSAKRRRNADGSVCDSSANCSKILSGKLDELAQAIRSTLLQINEVNERNNERRHKEMLDLISKCFKRDEPGPSKRKRCGPELGTDMYSRLVEETIDDGNGDDANNFVVESLDEEFLLENSFTVLPADEPLQSQLEIVEQIEPVDVALSHRKKRDKHDVQLVREKLLAMQRKKMEDIELKNRNRRA